jgi:alpha-ribazole phosphatase
MAEAFRLPLVADPDFREMSLGAWEGLTVPEIQAAFPGAYERWLEDPLAAPAPGGEALADFAARTARAFARMRAAHPERDAILVSHGGVIKSLVCDVLGLELRHLFRIKQDNTALNVVAVSAAGRRLLLLNDTCHLRRAGDGLAAGDVLIDGPASAEPAG